MKLFLSRIIVFLVYIGTAFADYPLIVPSPKGTGTSIWADVVSA